MAQISFEQASQSNNNYSGGNQVGFFTLKNDGEEAVVRFMYDNTSQFDLFAVHPIQVEGRYRKVNCLRDPRDPMEKCPFCASGTKIENRFFIKLLQYTRDDNGNIIVSPKIWDRPFSYANQLATLINEYGPLSEHIFKVKRSGAARSLDTTYQIMYASPQVYRPELYVKKPELFDGYKINGGLVMDKTYDEIVEFMNTGKFPERRKVEQVSNQVNNTSPTMPDFPDPLPTQPVPNQNWTGGYTQPTQTPYPNAQFTPVQTTQTSAPWEASGPINRPVRIY